MPFLLVGCSAQPHRLSETQGSHVAKRTPPRGTTPCRRSRSTDSVAHTRFLPCTSPAGGIPGAGHRLRDRAQPPTPDRRRRSERAGCRRGPQPEMLEVARRETIHPPPGSVALVEADAEQPDHVAVGLDGPGAPFVDSVLLTYPPSLMTHWDQAWRRGHRFGPPWWSRGDRRPGLAPRLGPAARLSGCSRGGSPGSNGSSTHSSRLHRRTP